MIFVSPQVPLPLKHPSIVPAFPPRSSPSRVVMAIVDVFLGVVKAVVFIYDIVTFPVYQVSETNVHMSMHARGGPLRAKIIAQLVFFR